MKNKEDINPLKPPYSGFYAIFALMTGHLIPILFLLTPAAFSAQVLQAEAPASVESQLIEAAKQQLTGNPDKAIELYEKLRSEKEAEATVYYQLSRLYLSKSRLEDALHAIDESVKADPTNKWTRIFQANLFESVGRYRNTAEAYEGLCFIEPQNYTMYDLAALHYVKADMDDKALAMLDRAQARFGPMPTLVIKKSRILNHLGKGRKAVELLNLSIREYPNHLELHEELYQLLVSLPASEEAVKVLARIRELNPGYNPPGQNAKPSAEGSLLEKIRLQVIGGNSTAEEIIRSLIPFVDRYQDTDTAMLGSIAELLIEKYPKEARVWALKGDLHYYAEDYREAVKAYGAASSLQNVPYAVWENMMLCLMRLNHWKTLTEKIDQALDYYPNQAFLYYAYGVARLQLSQFDEAYAQAQQFTLMSASSKSRKQEADLLMARILSAQGKTDEAEPFWKACLESENNDAAILEYAVYRSSKGLSVDSKKLEAVSSSRALFRPFVLNRLATASYHLKDWNTARTLMDECLGLKGGQVTDNYELAALIQIAIGQKDQARNYLRMAIQATDDRTRLENLLNRLN